MRIVSLVPSQTELLHYLLPAEQIVGITRFCIHPREYFKSTPKIGGTKDFDFEKIDELKPDLIIANKEENYKEGIEQLQKKYRVWMSDIYTVEDALEMIETVGDLVNKSKKAKDLTEKIKQKFEAIKAHSIPQSKNFKVAYFIWRKPFMVVGQNNYINDILHQLGMENVFEHLDSRYPEINEQQLENLNPNYILLSSEPYPFKERHKEIFRKICPNATIEIVDGEMFSWYGSRMLKAGDYLLDFQKKLISHSI